LAIFEVFPFRQDWIIVYYFELLIFFMIFSLNFSDGHFWEGFKIIVIFAFLVIYFCLISSKA